MIIRERQRGRGTRRDTGASRWWRRSPTAGCDLKVCSDTQVLGVVSIRLCTSLGVAVGDERGRRDERRHAGQRGRACVGETRQGLIHRASKTRRKIHRVCRRRARRRHGLPIPVQRISLRRQCSSMRRSRCVHRIHLNTVEPTGVRGEQGSRSLLLRLNLLLLNLDLLLLMKEDTRKERNTLLDFCRRMLRALCIPLGMRETVRTDTPPTPVKVITLSTDPITRLGINRSLVACIENRRWRSMNPSERHKDSGRWSNLARKR